MQNTPFKVIQGHRFWYQLNAYIRLLISDYRNTNLPPILHRFQVMADYTCTVRVKKVAP